MTDTAASSPLDAAAGDGHSAAKPGQCHYCWTGLRPGARFCPGCGTPAGERHPPSRPRGERAPVPAEPGNDARMPAEQLRFDTRLAALKRVAWLFSLLLLCSLLLGIAARNDTTPWSDVIFTFVQAAIVLAFFWRRRADIMPLYRAPHAGRATAIKLAALCAAVCVLLWVYFTLLARAGAPFLHVSADYQKAGWSVGVMLLFISLIPAAVEELACRGIMQHGLEQVLGSREALIVQAALFSALHLQPLILPSHFLLGLCLGYLRLHTRSLYPGMALHAAWNAAVLFYELHAA